MTHVARHPPGAFCWVELATTDAAAAKRFYQSLMGWEAYDTPARPGLVYSLLRRDGKDVAALYEPPDRERAPGTLPHWLSYIAVASADDTASRVERLGGKVVEGPFDVFDAGRMAVLQDPTGAVFAIWQGRTHFGADVVNEPGALCWNELATSDLAATRRFYSALFGWSVQEQPVGAMTYLSMMNGGAPACGIFTMAGDEWKGTRPHWMVYFAVDACDECAEHARGLGGHVRVEPTDIPNVGRFAVIRDPQGAIFSIIALAQAA